MSAGVLIWFTLNLLGSTEELAFKKYWFLKKIKLKKIKNTDSCNSLMWSPSFFILVFNFVKYFIIFCVVQFSRSVASDSLRPHGLQHARLPCPSPTPRAYSNSCPLSGHPTISSSVVPFTSCLQSFPASGSFQMSQFFTLGGQSIRASASLLLISFRLDWFDFLTVKGLSRVFSNATVQKHQFFSAQLSLWSNSHVHTWLLEKS